MATKKKSGHGRYCCVCGAHKPNEQFSGKGHAAHICKACAALPPERRAESLVLNRLSDLACRYITEKERNWLEAKCHDSNPVIKKAAQELFAERFPRTVRNREKKAIAITAIDFFVHGEVYDEYGDPVDVHARFIADRTGNFRYIDYAADDVEQAITINPNDMRKFLKSLVHEWEVPFWAEDMTEDNPSFDPDVDMLPDDLDDFDDPDDIPTLDVLREDEEPLCSLIITLRSGEERRMAFYQGIHMEAMELYWHLADWFADESMTIEEIEDAPFE